MLEIQKVEGGQLIRKGSFGQWKRGDVIPADVWDRYARGEMVRVSPTTSYQRHT